MGFAKKIEKDKTYFRKAPLAAKIMPFRQEEA
jgi:hypothetical protein